MTQTLSDIISNVLSAKNINDSFEVFHASDRVALNLGDELRQAVFCADCDGEGLVHDHENEDYNQDSDGFTYCGGWMHCPTCKGTGFAFDVSPVAIRGEDQQAIGVQAIPGLTSTPTHGATEATSGTLDSTRGAETVGLSFEVDCLLASMNLLAIQRNTLCTEAGPGYAILDSAYQHLNRQLRQMLTSGGAL